MHQNGQFVSPANTHALLFYRYFVFRLIRSNLQVFLALQMAFLPSPRQPNYNKHFLFDFMYIRSMKISRNKPEFSSELIHKMSPSQTTLIDLLTFNRAVILLAYLPDHPETACSGPELVLMVFESHSCRFFSFLFHSEQDGF